MIRRRLPTSITIAVTIVGTVLGMRISAMTQISKLSTVSTNNVKGAMLEQQPVMSNSDYYPVTVIAEDGSQIPLTGKDLHVDLGGGRLLEIHLKRHKKGWLEMWSPYKREDTHVNYVVLHPYCANSFALDLDRHQIKSDETDSAVYEVARAVH